MWGTSPLALKDKPLMNTTIFLTLSPPYITHHKPDLIPNLHRDCLRFNYCRLLTFRNLHDLATEPSSTKALVHYEHENRRFAHMARLSYCNNIVVQKCRYPNPNEARSPFCSYKSIQTNRLHLFQGSKTGLPNMERSYSYVIYEQLNLRFHYETML